MQVRCDSILKAGVIFLLPGNVSYYFAISTPARQTVAWETHRADHKQARNCVLHGKNPNLDCICNISISHSATLHQNWWTMAVNVNVVSVGLNLPIISLYMMIIYHRSSSKDRTCCQLVRLNGCLRYIDTKWPGPSLWANQHYFKQI